MGSPIPGESEVGTARVPRQRSAVRLTRQESSGPRQLPPVPAHFTNRAAELEVLEKLLAQDDADGPAVHLISGQGGIGKTALAAAWGRHLGDRFPDGHLWADLGGFSTNGPLTASEALGRFLRALGVPPEGLPADVEELTALYRTTTAERPLLVLLDNAGSTEQVLPLLPSCGDSVVIVTSRRRLGRLQTEHRAKLIELAPFGSAHSAELLGRAVGTQRIGAEAGQAQAIAELCGGLPIALTTISAKLAGRPKMSLAKIATELGKEYRRLATLSTKEAQSVEASFNLSYDELPSDAAALYAALGLHPGPDFGVGVAAASIAVREEVADDLLDQLVDVGLLIDRGDDRYTFHDLARLHAKEKTAGNEYDRDIAVRRMLEWYLFAASATADLTTPDQDGIPYRYEYRPSTPTSFDTREEALAWLELERENLIAAVETAHDWQLPELGWQLAAAMWPLFLLRKHYPDFLRVSEIGVRCAVAWGNVSAEALMRNRGGAACRGTGRYDDAVRHYLAGRDAARTAGNHVVEIRSVEGLGLVALQQGRLDEAIEWFTEDHLLSERQDRPHDVGLALINLGATRVRAGQAEAAIADLTRARDVLAGDDYNVARARIELGRALTVTGDFPAARAELEPARATMKASGSRFEVARTLLAFGEIAEADGDREEARLLYDQALPIFVGLGRPEADALRTRLEQL
ncbi:tetratricopeptide repeat protein [Amycolatopsis umgeniensis]|uniref:Tetratricopeptide (TPR) repeat protein n=1 Tax=Amycolatopsis umgeniensis TaxID=336628 RepID=A0A841B5G8_9PSEU|nr:tetratricopeptide repeat protein [Amycolatopsis umgeniensis]MBB5854193.1 tetratricopeptide (TPR) repeat protein [Amycolatopsis umgeniensis]